MLSDLDIQKKCFLNTRFYQSVKELTERYPDNEFDRLLRESLETIIEVAENFDGSNVFRSKFYAEDFAEEAGITLEKGNPFCVALFSESLSINIVFIILEEYKKWGYTFPPLGNLSNLKKSHIVCAFDLFDFSKNESLYRIKRKC